MGGETRVQGCSALWSRRRRVLGMTKAKPTEWLARSPSAGSTPAHSAASRHPAKERRSARPHSSVHPPPRTAGTASAPHASRILAIFRNIRTSAWKWGGRRLQRLGGFAIGVRVFCANWSLNASIAAVVPAALGRTNLRAWFLIAAAGSLFWSHSQLHVADRAGILLHLPGHSFTAFCAKTRRPAH